MLGPIWHFGVTEDILHPNICGSVCRNSFFTVGPLISKYFKTRIIHKHTIFVKREGLL
jgi:hypothetical protein